MAQINIKKIYSQDQKDRTGRNWKDSKSLRDLAKRDRTRRLEVRKIIKKGAIKTPQDLYYAAMVLHHSNSLEDYALAVALSATSMLSGNEDGRWLFARALDRLMRKIGLPQKFGTQFSQVKGRWVLDPYDPTTTDKEREQYDVPTIKFQKEIRSKQLEEGKP